ncbi:MAG: hypothetical protein IJ236_07020 [Oscillospiraceae bacterium]|nr:hypothetical protein [Oscillospiraceae bacterium]
MKQSKQCPKCGSRDLCCFVNDGFLDGSAKGIAVGATIFSNVSVERYICCGCGYTEQWVSPGDIQKLKQSSKAKPVNQ